MLCGGPAERRLRFQSSGANWVRDPGGLEIKPVVLGASKLTSCRASEKVWLMELGEIIACHNEAFSERRPAFGQVLFAMASVVVIIGGIVVFAVGLCDPYPPPHSYGDRPCPLFNIP